MDALLKVFCCYFRREIEQTRDVENVGDLWKKLRSIGCVQTFALHCIFYGQTTNSNLKLLVNFCCCCCSFDVGWSNRRRSLHYRGRFRVHCFVRFSLFLFLSLSFSLFLAIENSSAWTIHRRNRAPIKPN